MILLSLVRRIDPEVFSNVHRICPILHTKDITSGRDGDKILMTPPVAGESVTMAANIYFTPATMRRKTLRFRQLNIYTPEHNLGNTNLHTILTATLLILPCLCDLSILCSSCEASRLTPTSTKDTSSTHRLT